MGGIASRGAGSSADSAAKNGETVADGGDGNARDAVAASLTAAEKDAIRASWEVIEKNQKAIGIAFFVKLFTEYPEYLQTFSRLRKVADPNDLANNKFLQAHALGFMRGMGTLVENADDLECADELLYKIASRHQPFGLKPKDMQNAIDMFVSILHPNAVFDELEQPSEFIAKAWKHAFDIVVPIIGGYMEDLQRLQDDDEP